MRDELIKQPNITLAAIASSYVHSALAPWCLKAGVKTYAQTTCRVRVVEGTVNETIDQVAQRLIQDNPHLIGISCYIWNISFVEKLLPLLRQALPHCVLVLGGPEVSPLSEDTLARCKEADYVLCGEGEKSFALLVDALAGIGSLETVPGLCFRQGDKFQANPPSQQDEMSPSPYDDDYFAQLNNRIAYLETSRGCPFHCAFCLSGKGERVRYTSLERAKSEMVALAQSGTQTVKLVDRTFNADANRARELFRFVIEQQGKGIPRGVCFHFEIGGDLLDESTLALLATAPVGCIQLEIGIQSLNEETLRSVRRFTPVNALLEKLRRVIAPDNVHVHVDLIAGLPQEGLSSFIEGFNRAFQLHPHALQLGFLKIIPGSAMRLDRETYPCLYDPQPPYQVQSTPWLKGEELQQLATAEQALEKLYNRGRFAKTMMHLAAEGRHTAYDLFLHLGQRLVQAETERNSSSLPLDVLTDVVFDALCGLYPAEEEKIRSLMLRDRLTTTATPFIPKLLRVRHPAFHPAREKLKALYPPKPGVYRGVSLCQDKGEMTILWADYEAPHPVTGRYLVREMPIEDL